MDIIEVEADKQIALSADLAREIWNEHYGDTISKNQISYMLDKFQSQEAITASIENDGYTYYLFYKDKTPFGYMAVRPKGDRLFLSKLYIHKDFRGNGYSKKAFAFVEELAKNEEKKSIWLTCNKDNSSSLAVYDKIGFKIVDSVVMDIGSGFVMDDYILEKNL